jgi:hypothetical protein
MNLNINGFLEKEEIQVKANSVFTNQPYETLSDKYVHIPTSQVIDDMKLLGWEVVDAKEIKARKRIGFQKHLVIFSNPSFFIEDKEDNKTYLRILLINSHDGKNSFQFSAGLYRQICENGLVVSDAIFEKLRIRHINYSFDELQDQIKHMVERVPLISKVVNKMKSTILEDHQIIKLAKNSILTRFGNNVRLDINELITPKRKEDESKDLWTSFNVIQENIIKGTFNYFNDKGKIRKARPIKNFTQSKVINQELFEQAVNFLN